LNWTLKSIPLGLQGYNDDGGWVEGPMYWDYATRYTIYYIAALQTALNTDYGLIKQLPGLNLTGNFRIQTTSPSFQLDNFADSMSDVPPNWAMIWMGHQFGVDRYIAHERMMYSPKVNNKQKVVGVADILHLLFTKSGDAKKAMDYNSLPKVAWFKQIDVVTIRTMWNDSNACFVAIKGGNTSANHQHLDLGTFFIENEGERFVIDLGGGNYALPGYFNTSGPRYQWYKTSSRSHNVLTFNGENNQVIGSKSKVIDFGTGPDISWAVVNLTAAYSGNASSVTRQITMMHPDNKCQSILIEDNIMGNINTHTITWTLHTQSNVKIAENIATLQQNNSTMVFTIVWPPNVQWISYSYNPPPPQEQTPNLQVLQFHLTAGVQEHTFIKVQVN